MLPVQPAGNWEHWGGGRECPTPCAVTEGGHSGVARWGHQCACTPSAGLCLTRALPTEQGCALQTNTAGVGTASGSNRTASDSHSQLQAHLTAQQEPFSSLKSCPSPPGWCWRSCTQLRCSAEPKFLKMPLVLTRQQLSTSNYILQHKSHYCSWLNCSSGCRMPLCTVQPSLGLQFQGQPR